MNGGYGIATRQPDGALVSRARDYLAAGPADAVSLVARVCQLPGVPAAVAEHLARTLLGGASGFECLPDGRWALAAGQALTGTRADGSPARVAEEARMPLAFRGPGESSLAPCPEDAQRLADMSFVVVDVETTGGRPLAGDRVTEFAAVVVRGGAVAERYETLLNPDRPIPPWISRLTNISWEMVRDAPRFSVVCDDVLRIMDGHVFVAHNARFDWGFVSMEVSRATGRELAGRQLCTVRLARRLLPQLRRRSLDFVADHYNVGIAARHRAMGDALATAHVLVGLLRDAADRGCETWGDLERLLATPASTSRRRRRPSALPSPVTRDTSA